MSDEEAETMLGFVKGCYRLLGSIAENLVLLGGVVERASGVSPHGARPTQAALPLDDGLPAPGEVAHRIAAAPREWGNSVRFYEAVWRKFGGSEFGLGDLFSARDEIADATNGKIGLSTYQRVLSALVRAGAATRRRRAYALRQPTDQLREAVEAARNTRKEH